MKQEIYRWVEGNNSRRLIEVSQPNEVFRAVALVELRDAAENYFGWSVWSTPSVSGHALTSKRGGSATLDYAKEAAALEIQRQLKAQGIEVEIRRVLT